MRVPPEPHHPNAGEPAGPEPAAEPAPEPAPGSAPEPATGRHGLGPHVVGHRVVVRRLLRGETGPSGGPAMTDLLGTCLAWDSEACVVRPDGDPDAEAVRIPLSDIVSGKPVPPRTPPRHRVGTRAAELHVLSLFPGLEVVPLGDWLLRFDPAPRGRPRKRANSCLAIGGPGTSYADAVAAVRAFYADRDHPPLCQVEAGSDVEEALLGLGWTVVPEGEAEFRLTSLAQVRRARQRQPAPAPRPSGPPAVGLEVAGASAEATVREAGAVLARGRATLDGDWLGLHDLTVATEHRRRGLAGVVLDELLEWGAEQGASTAWLHVETDNTPGLALYEGLGFDRHHVCRYLEPRDLKLRGLGD